MVKIVTVTAARASYQRGDSFTAALDWINQWAEGESISLKIRYIGESINIQFHTYSLTYYFANIGTSSFVNNNNWVRTCVTCLNGAQIIKVLPISLPKLVTQCHSSQTSVLAKRNQVFPIICMRYQIKNLKKIHSPLYFDRQNQIYCSLCLQNCRQDHLKR